MIEQSYKGYLLAAHPKRSDSLLRRSVILVLDHDSGGAVGLQINKPYTNDITLKTVMENVNLSVDVDQPLYYGGTESSNRIHIVHTLDWYSPTTTKITDHIGVSNDLSVLAAISKNEGPNFYRACAGFVRWMPGHLDGEILGEEPWNISQSWSFTPATVETLFSLDDIDQWHRVIGESSRLQVSNWF